MNAAAFVGNDERSLELAHVLGVDAEVGLDRHFNVNAFRHVDEGTTRPHGRVEGGELVVAVGNHRAKILLDNLGVFLEPAVHVEEEHTLGFQILANGVVHGL